MASMQHLRKFYFAAICFYFMIWTGHCDIRELYSTKQKTSDLKWTIAVGWEEVSGFDEARRGTVRTYQVCKSNEPNQDNWIRSTYIRAKKDQRLHVQIEFSIMKCDNPQLAEAKHCRETFNLFYYESDTDVASSTFPPWKERPYIKVDTVAANTANTVNNKTFTVGPLRRNGLYIAVQDQGACMSITGLRVYYYYCPEKTAKLATFPMTNAGGEATSLVPFQGTCVASAQRTNGEIPTYHCNSDGKWKILTGGCQCDPGYKQNSDATLCQPCSPGTFKPDAGNDDCVVCPANSGLAPTSNASTSGKTIGLDFCPCIPGFFRSLNEPKTVPCSQPPTKPRAVTATPSATEVLLRWKSPEKSGGRDDISYSVSCQECRNPDYVACTPCSQSVDIPTTKLSSTEGSVSIAGLKPFSSYVFRISARNGVSGLSNKPAAYAETKVSTLEAAPSPIRSIYLSKRTGRTLEIKWRQPQEPNGIIGKYEIEIRPANKNHQRIKSPPMLRESTSTTAVIEDLEPGTAYVIRIRTSNSVGFSTYSEPYQFQTGPHEVGTSAPQSDGSNTVIIVVAVVVSIIFVVVIGVVYYRCRGHVSSLPGNKQKNKQNGPSTREQESLIGQRIYVEYPDPSQAVKNLNRELDITSLTLLDKIIGEGEFAEVLHGNLLQRGEACHVAVKQLKHGASVKDQANFLREACSMAQFDHPNILQLKGVITKSRPVMIVSEFMANGSLDEFLRRNQADISEVQLIGMLQGIASGMAYLSKMKYVHRDLAARNILVNSESTCKVSDFGLSRALENDPHATYTTQGGKIAIRWAAPECIRFRQFTSGSDVWSYGIVMWEVMSYGEKPYWDMTNQEVVQNIEGGMRLPAPTSCPKALHNKMVECWSSDPKKRPKFWDLAAELDNLKKTAHTQKTMPSNNSSTTLAAACATPNLQSALNHGEISTVEEWLKCQRLDKYKDRFLSRGLDSLEKVSDLTIKDLRALGIDVTLHVHKLENGIRSLRRHLSTSSSRPTSAYSADDLETGDDDVMLPSSSNHNDSHTRSLRNGTIGRPETIKETEALIPEGSVAV